MKPKIVILATYVGVINRGAETFVIELVKKLREYYDIEIYSLGINNEIKDQTKKVELLFPAILKYHAFLYNKSKIYRKFCDLSYYLIPMVLEQYFFSNKVYREYLQNRDDINLVFPANGIHGIRIAKTIRKLKNVPYIYVGHGGIGEGEQIILKSKPNMYISLTPSADVWAKKYSKNVQLVPNGVDVEYFTRKTPIDKKELNVLCVGAFTSFKRQKLLIDAMVIVGQGNLTLLGSGELEEELLQYGKKKLGKRFELLSVSYDEIKQYYENSNVFSLPSLNEPFGIVYAEALSMNIPVVAPNDEARAYVVGDSGVLCNVEDPDEYANAILKCFRSDYENIPRKRAEELYSWNILAKKYKQIINDLVLLDTKGKN